MTSREVNLTSQFNGKIYSSHALNKLLLWVMLGDWLVLRHTRFGRYIIGIGTITKACGARA